MKKDIPPEKIGAGDAARQAERHRRAPSTRCFPTIADQAKNAFIRANPQMQLGIIEVVDRIALTLVSPASRARPVAGAHLGVRLHRRGDATQLIDFYSSDVGKKFADLQPKMLAVEVTAAQEWGRSVADELTTKVQEELRAAMAAEQQMLQGDTPARGAGARPGAIALMDFDYDLFVIGAGSGGVRAARKAAETGARVAIAEADRVGGTCVIRGCVPKKLLVYASQFREAFEDSAVLRLERSARPSSTGRR